MRASHSSRSAGGRAFRAGNEPTIPALHCAITRSGTEMMKSGAPMTGMDRRPLKSAGIDMDVRILSPECMMVSLQSPAPKQLRRACARLCLRKIALLTDHADRTGVGAAFAFG